VHETSLFQFIFVLAPLLELCSNPQAMPGAKILRSYRAKKLKAIVLSK